MLAILNCRAIWAADVEINVKAGLWEVTRTVEVKSGMSAAEKAAKEHVQKTGLSAGGLVALLDKPMVTQECFAEGQVSGWAYPQSEMRMAQNACKRVKVKSARVPTRQPESLRHI